MVQAAGGRRRQEEAGSRKAGGEAGRKRCREKSLLHSRVGPERKVCLARVVQRPHIPISFKNGWEQPTGNDDLRVWAGR